MKRGCKFLAQLVLLNLAHCVARQLGHDFNVPRTFETRKVAARDVLDGCGVDRGAILGHQHGNHSLSKIGMRRANHSAFFDVGQGIKEQLDFLGIDVVATRNDQILAAPHDVDITLCVDQRQITGDKEPIVTQLFACLFRHLPIALEHVWATHPQNTDLSGGQLCSGLWVADLCLNPRQREPDRARAPRPFIRVGGVHRGFCHAVAFQNAVACTVLKLRMCIGQQGRRARDEETHVRDQIFGKTGLIQKAGVEGGHAHHRRGLGQAAQYGFNVKLGQEDHRPSGQQHDIRGYKQPMAVENWQRMQQHIIAGKPPCLDQRSSV